MTRTSRAAFALAVLLAGAGLVRAEWSGAAGAVYVFKPLATVAVLAMVLASPPLPSSRFRSRIAFGLVWSLAGDVLLMLPADRFAAGLGCFLVAHLCYIAAFASDGPSRRTDVRTIAPFAFIAGFMLAALWPVLGGLRAPVAIYVGVIATMASQAWSRWKRRRTPGAMRAAVGATLFLVSDATLSLDRFRGPIGDARTMALLVLGTYLAAQWLIASAVGDDDAG